MFIVKSETLMSQAFYLLFIIRKTVIYISLLVIITDELKICFEKIHIFSLKSNNR